MLVVISRRPVLRGGVGVHGAFGEDEETIGAVADLIRRDLSAEDGA